MTVEVVTSEATLQYNRMVRRIFPVLLIASALWVAGVVCLAAAAPGLFLSHAGGVSKLLIGVLMLFAAIGYTVANLMSRSIKADVGVFWLFTAIALCTSVAAFISLATT